MVSANAGLAKFQFALPRGERREVMGYWLIDSLFQFALPRGERLP